MVTANKLMMLSSVKRVLAKLADPSMGFCLMPALEVSGGTRPPFKFSKRPQVHSWACATALSRRPQSCKSKPEGLKQLCVQSGPSLQPPAATGLLGRRVWQGSAYFWAVDGLDCKRAQRASGTLVTDVVFCCYLGLIIDS